jgi:hypothetical protein
MGIGTIIFICIIGLPVMGGLLALVPKRHNNSSRQTSRKFFLVPTLWGTTDPHKTGLWYTTNWYLGERVNEAIREGQERYAHKSRRSHRTHRQH